jgi:hypothetical protein
MSWLGSTVLVIIVMFAYDKIADTLKSIERNTRKD